MAAASNATNVMMNAAPWFGVSGGVAALAAIPHTETKLVTCAVMFALAVSSALRKYCFSAPVKAELADYPFSSHVAPWARDGGPRGL